MIIYKVDLVINVNSYQFSYCMKPKQSARDQFMILTWKETEQQKLKDRFQNQTQGLKLYWKRAKLNTLIKMN